MTEPPRRHDVTITLDRDGDHLPNPAEFAVAAGRAASARVAGIVSTHTADQIISIVTVLAADQPAAVAGALAVVSDVLKRPVASSIRCPDRRSRSGAAARRTGHPGGPWRCTSIVTPSQASSVSALRRPEPVA